jgi:hypothetical protein
VNRGRANQDSSPAQRPRHRDPESAQEPTPLPAYEPPTCALTPTAKHALETLRATHDYSKYKRHLDGSIKAITNSIGDSNDRLRVRKEDLAKAASRRSQAEEGEEKSQEDIERELYVDGMEKKVRALTVKAEKALRDLIDYGDELTMKETMMKEVSENIAAAPPPRPAIRRQRRQGSNEDENAENEEVDVEEDEEPEVDGSIISAVELLRKAQEEYTAEYASKSMRSRYRVPFTNSTIDAHEDLDTIQTITEASKRPFISPSMGMMFLSLTQELGSQKTIGMEEPTLVAIRMIMNPRMTK